MWAKDSNKDLDSLFAKDYRSIIVDLSLDDDQVRTLTAARTLEALWSQGEEKRKAFLRDETTSWNGTVVVIDEGHLFAPPETADPQKRLVSEKIQRFADQGKKLNLYLMVVTQQPGKLHPSVLSEFNNRIILRVNERRSLSALEETYGGSRGRYDGALTFEPGEALIEGALLRDESPPASLPRGIRFKLARTREAAERQKPTGRFRRHPKRHSGQYPADESSNIRWLQDAQTVGRVGKRELEASTPGIRLSALTAGTVVKRKKIGGGNP